MPINSKGCHELFERNKAVHNIHNQALSLGWHIKHEAPEAITRAYSSDEESAFCARYLTLMWEDAPPRDYPLRATFNALRYMVRAGCPWRMMPHDLPPWYSVQQQAQRWMRAGCFEAMAQDLRKVLRLLAGRHTEPSAVILDGRTLQSTPESGARAGYDGHKRKRVPRSMPRSILWVICRP